MIHRDSSLKWTHMFLPTCVAIILYTLYKRIPYRESISKLFPVERVPDVVLLRNLGDSEIRRSRPVKWSPRSQLRSGSRRDEGLRLAGVTRRPWALRTFLQTFLEPEGFWNPKKPDSLARKWPREATHSPTFYRHLLSGSFRVIFEVNERRNTNKNEFKVIFTHYALQNTMKILCKNNISV